jgi:acetyl esterase/lipase
MVALTAEYRVQNRHGTSPWECLEDAASAMVWARGNAARLGLDPARLAAGGGSAGGHLAACLGTYPIEAPGARADAMVLFNPVLDVRRPKWAGRFAPRGLDRACPPLHVGPETPPAIVLHGREDQVVPAADSEAFASAIAAAGGRCELRLYDGAGHGFFNYARRGDGFYAPTLREVDRFLPSLGFLDGPPEI